MTRKEQEADVTPRAPQPDRAPTKERTHERAMDDPGRGQGDVLDDKIPDSVQRDRSTR